MARPRTKFNCGERVTVIGYPELGEFEISTITTGLWHGKTVYDLAADGHKETVERFEEELELVVTWKDVREGDYVTWRGVGLAATSTPYEGLILASPVEYQGVLHAWVRFARRPHGELGNPTDITTEGRPLLSIERNGEKL